MSAEKGLVLKKQLATTADVEKKKEATSFVVHMPSNQHSCCIPCHVTHPCKTAHKKRRMCARVCERKREMCACVFMRVSFGESRSLYIEAKGTVVCVSVYRSLKLKVQRSKAKVNVVHCNTPRGLCEMSCQIVFD